jgi:hypothetical protein
MQCNAFSFVKRLLPLMQSWYAEKSAFNLRAKQDMSIITNIAGYVTSLFNGREYAAPAAVSY